MDIGDFLLDIATSFDRAAPMSSLPQTKLRRAGDYLEEHIPGGLLIIGSGGRGGPTFTPWVGVFDPDETSSPQHGIYVVYLFATDLQSVTLSLNQGMEEVRRELGDKGARARLALDAENVRDALPPESLTNLSKEMDLGPDSGARQKAYEAANIACLRYEVDSMPDEVDLRADLSRFLVLYEDAIAQKQWLLQHSPGSIGSSVEGRKPWSAAHSPYSRTSRSCRRVFTSFWPVRYAV